MTLTIIVLALITIMTIVIVGLATAMIALFVVDNINAIKFGIFLIVLKVRLYIDRKKKGIQNGE